MPSFRIQQLKLTHFRNLGAVTVAIPENESGQLICLIGENGAGKTSVLEALSLLSPGRGLHTAAPSDMVQHGCQQWGVFCETTEGDTIGQTGTSVKKTKQRQLKINGTDAKQAALSGIGSVLWLTPAQNRLFLDGAAARRGYLDRMVFGLQPSHAETLTRYLHHVRNRLRLLKNSVSGEWLDLEEKQAAQFGVQVLRNRKAYLEALQPQCARVQLQQKGATLEILETDDPVVELRGKFERSRERDADLGATSTGAQKVDVTGELILNDGAKVPLHQASSGQHKRALVHWLLAHVRLVTEKTGNTPLVLLDELSAHLDAARQAETLEALLGLGAQVWASDVAAPKGVDFMQVNVVEGEAFVS